MTKDELLALIYNYCEVNDILYHNDKSYIIDSISYVLRHNFNNLQIVIDKEKKQLVDIVPGKWDMMGSYDRIYYKRISITHLIRADRLSKLLDSKK
jgi:hypothetical protein